MEMALKYSLMVSWIFDWRWDNSTDCTISCNIQSGCFIFYWDIERMNLNGSAGRVGGGGGAAIVMVRMESNVALAVAFAVDVGQSETRRSDG